VLGNSIKKIEFPNGLRILVHVDRKTPIVSVTVAMMGGLMVETESDNGISNFTAKMLLRGTKARQEAQIRGVVEEKGGSIASGVSKSLDYLVVGDGGGAGSKLDKAKKFFKR